MSDKKIIERTLEISLTKESFRVLDEKERIIELAFASEYPVERWDGIEILECTTNAADLTRLNSGGAFLMNHDRYDQVGVVLEARVDDDKKIRAKVKLSRSARGLEVFNDVADGILRNVSFGYAVHEETRTKGTNGQPDTYRVTKFTPFEISLVSIPADPTVGIGRGLPTPNEGEKMPDENKTPEKVSTTPVQSIDYNAERAKARQEEVARINEIRAVSRQFFSGSESDKLIDEHAEKGTSVENFRKFVLQTLAKRTAEPHEQSEGVPAVTLGLSDKEIKHYSFLRMLRALADGKPEKAGLEYECSQAIAKRSGKEPLGMFAPVDMVEATPEQRGWKASQARSLNINSAAAGGNIVSTNLMGANFIELLQAFSVTSLMGCEHLTGLVDNIELPKQTSNASSYWVGDTSDVGESDITFGQVPLPRNVIGTYCDISRGLLNQSSIPVEAFVLKQLLTAIALGIDLQAITGTGTNNKPKGLLHTDGISTLTYSGGIAWGDIVDLETALAEVNAYQGALSYVTTPGIVGSLKKTQKAPTLGFIWENGTEGVTPYFGTVNGHRALGSTQIPTGNMFFADWSKMAFGWWSGLDVLVDPYTGGKSGTRRVRVLQDVGLAILRPESFAILKPA